MRLEILPEDDVGPSRLAIKGRKERVRGGEIYWVNVEVELASIPLAELKKALHECETTERKEQSHG